MKQDLNNIKEILNKHAGFLRNNYQVKEIGVFGSAARGENTKTSDIDLLVEFLKPIGLFKFIELEEYLSRITGKKVDLVTKNALKPAIKESILKEVVYV